jgi:UDP-N-acetylglucosamine:LPS N-acetylglucosamine transferase
LTKYEACFLGLPTVAIPRTVGEEWDTRGFVSNGLALELARDASTESLATSLHTLIADRFIRRALADACATTFTRDCTETASAAILDEVDRSPEEDAVSAG